MRPYLLALATVTASLAFALPAAAEEAAKADAKEPAKTEAAPPTEKPTAKSIEANNNDFLGKGSLIIGAERVFGFSSTTPSVDGKSGSTTTQWGILWGAPMGVFQVPRMAIDYVAFDQVTFGGALGVAHVSTDGGGSSTNLLVAPRAGYIFGGRGVLSLWARGGLTFWNVSAGSGASGSNWGTALNLEPEIIISPYKHLGIYLGAVLDLGMFGKIKSVDATGAETSVGYRLTNWGVTSGLRAWF